MQRLEDTARHSLKVIQTRDFTNFQPLVQELGFEDKFEISMRQWCGLREPEPSMKFWQVYLVKLGEEIIGVMGLYQLVNDEPENAWVGWFGVLPQFRQQGWGQMMMNQLKEYAVKFGFQELWVFTNYDNLGAIAFYEKSSFVLLGAASLICPGKTHDLSDIILKYRLTK